MPNQHLWNVFPIFVTSTFRDMHAERDHLRTHVFPALEERLAARRTLLEPIDLRWGVDTVKESELQAKELLILKVCLAEVTRSRFIIALLGDRYGWIPPEDRILHASREAGIDDVSAIGKSVGHLEIEFGALRSPERLSRALFYFREPLPYEDMDPEVAARMSDCHNADPSIQAAAHKLADLKERIQFVAPERVKRYRVQWDSEHACVTGIEEWGRAVLEDLWHALETSTGFVPGVEDTWQDRERFAIEQFMVDRGRGFIGRERNLDAICSQVLGPASESLSDIPWGICVRGPSGAGKSALLASLDFHGKGFG